ncbi:hypothetical protein REPUB_Repub07fG0166500 [Reevesia pubescens]
MVLIQLSYGASVILVKIAFARGLDRFVFVAYRHIIGLSVLGPVAFVLERKQRPSLSYAVFAKIFLLSSLGTSIYLNFFYLGLTCTSPTVASALDNVIPSLTFLMAVLLRMEKVKIRSASGQAKVLGTIICIGGSLVFTFWKGGYQLKGFVDRPLINFYSTKDSVGELRHGKENWLKGSCLILISNISWSAWLVLQGTIFKVYPAQLSLNALICFIGSLQSLLLTLFFARNPLLWKLEWNLQLLTIIYCGVGVAALANFLQSWCISYKGPVFASIFSPLCAVIVAIFSAIAFAERLHLGRADNKIVSTNQIKSFLLLRCACAENGNMQPESPAKLACHVTKTASQITPKDLPRLNHVMAQNWCINSDSSTKQRAPDICNIINSFCMLENRKQRPSISYAVFAKIFLLSSLGTSIYLNFFYLGLTYTSPTVASALNNVIPSLSFLMAVLLRMEKVKIRSASGQAKVLGTIICIGGSLVFTFWKGGYQLKGFVDRPLINFHSTKDSVGELRQGKENWLKGSCLILISTISWSAWLVLQGTIFKVYPAQLSLNALICFFGSLQSFLVTLLFARNPLLWKLEWNVQLLTIIYSVRSWGHSVSQLLTIMVYQLQGTSFCINLQSTVRCHCSNIFCNCFCRETSLGQLGRSMSHHSGSLHCTLGKSADNFVIGDAKDKNDLNDVRMLEISVNDCPTTTDKSIESGVKC